MKRSTFINSSLLTVLLLLSGSSYASDIYYDRVTFAVSAEQEVENDVLTAVLFASQNGQDTAILSEAVNKDINQALEIAKQEPVVDSRTLSYTTRPIYKNGRVDGWQVHQSIELKSKDSKALSGLLGQLQQSLKVQSIDYSLSTEVRQATEEALINKVLTGFKHRAAQVQENMKRSEYRVVQLDIQTDGTLPQPMFRAAGSEGMMMADAAPAPPGLDAGTQKVRVSVNAQIELSEN